MRVMTQPTPRNTLLGRGALDTLRGRVTRAGKPGEGGGENKRWLKLKLDEVADNGIFSFGMAVYEAALRKFRRGGETIILAVCGTPKCGAMSASYGRKKRYKKKGGGGMRVDSPQQARIVGRLFGIRNNIKERRLP